MQGWPKSENGERGCLLSANGCPRFSFSGMVIILTLMLFLVPFVPAAYADLGITPQLKMLDINRGGWTDFQLQITNHAEQGVEIEMTAQDMDVDESYTPYHNEEGTYDRGCADWINLTPEEFSLGPLETKSVLVKIRAPKESNGSYFSILSARLKELQTIELPGADKGESPPSMLKFKVSVGSVLFLTVRGSNNKAVLQPDTVILEPGGGGSDLDQLVLGDVSADRWVVKVPVHNTGNIYTLASGGISIWDENNQLISRAALEAGKGFVIPEKERTFIATGEKPLSNGSYLIRVNLHSKDSRSMTASFTFTVMNGVAYTGTQSEEIGALLASSSPGFNLGTRILSFEASPGATTTKGIVISSYSKDSLRITNRVIDWRVDEVKGRVKLVKDDPSNLDRSSVSWVSISPDTIVIPPGRKKSVKVKFQPPDDIEGEYYSAILFQPVGFKEDLPVEFEVNRTVFTAVYSRKSSKSSATIASFAEVKADKDGCSFEVALENTGNVHCYANGQIEIMDDENAPVCDPIKFGGEGEFIFPGTKRVYTIPYNELLRPGRYLAAVSVSYTDDVPSLNKSKIFHVK